MEKKIKYLKTAIIAVLVLVVIFGTVSSKLNKKAPDDGFITLYETSKEGEASSQTKAQIEDTQSTTDGAISAKVSLNNGTLEELMTIKGIGETKAKAIIEYREKFNGFVSIDEITEVKGIGEKTLEKIRNQICL